MSVKYLTAAILFSVGGMMLPSLSRGRETRTWSSFLSRKPLPLLCYGLAVGFAACALVAFLRAK